MKGWIICNYTLREELEYYGVSFLSSERLDPVTIKAEIKCSSELLTIRHLSRPLRIMSGLTAGGNGEEMPVESTAPKREISRIKEEIALQERTVQNAREDYFEALGLLADLFKELREANERDN